MLKTFYFTSACFDGCKPRETCTDADKGLNVNVKYLQFGRVQIPEEVEDLYLDALTLTEKAFTAELRQNATLVRKETDQMVGFVCF